VARCETSRLQSCAAIIVINGQELPRLGNNLIRRRLYTASLQARQKDLSWDFVDVTEGTMTVPSVTSTKSHLETYITNIELLLIQWLLGELAVWES